MPSLALDDRLIWFAHCPKTGGTSIETIMVDTWGPRVGHLHWGWDRWWRRGGWREAAPPNSPQHLVWSDAETVLGQAPDAAFALVRDPLARMASEHRWQRRGRRGTRAGRLLAWLPFAVWLRLMLRTARLNPHAFDNHFRAQDEFVPAGAAVFRIEDGLDAAVRWLEDRTQVALPVIPHRLATGTATRPVAAREAALVAQVFARDYARFGYAVPPDADAARPGLDRLVAALAPAIAALDRRGCL